MSAFAPSTIARERLGIAHLDVDTLPAAHLHLLRAHLPDHSAAVDKAVMGGKAGQLVQNVAGDEHCNAALPVQL